MIRLYNILKSGIVTRSERIESIQTILVIYLSNYINIHLIKVFIIVIQLILICLENY